MRIAAYIHPDRANNPTGVGKHIINMVSGLAKFPGFDVSVMATSRELEGGLRISGNGPLANLPVLPIAWSRSILERFWEFTNRPKPENWAKGADWIYCPGETPIAKGRTPLAVTLHDAHFFEPSLAGANSQAYRMRWQWLAQLIARRADLLLTVSEFSKARFIKYLNVPPEKIAVVYNGVEDHFFVPQDRAYMMDVERPYLLVVGGLNARKNASAVLAITAVLRELGSNITTRIVGNDLSGLDGQAHLHPNLEMLGYVTDEQLKELLGRSVALLFPSLYEGFGIPAVEAMAVGTPAVVSRSAALPEVVGDAGVYIDPADVRASARTILKLMTDVAFRGKLIEKGRMRAECFRWTACVERLAKALKECARSSK
jgi:glycosyltransferase involved in cell wall biosynthesis